MLGKFHVKTARTIIWGQSRQLHASLLYLVVRDTKNDQFRNGRPTQPIIPSAFGSQMRVPSVPSNKPVCVRSMGENNVRNRSIYCFGDQSLFRISVQGLDIPSP